MENFKTDLDSFFGPKNETNYLKFQLELFKRANNRDIRLVQNLTMGEADFNLFRRLRNLLVIAAETYGVEENLSLMLMPTKFKETDEQLKLAHKMNESPNRANKKIRMTLLRYSVEKPKSSISRFRKLANKKEDEKFQQIVFVNQELEKLIYLVDVMNSVNDKFVTNQPILISFKK